MKSETGGWGGWPLLLIPLGRHGGQGPRTKLKAAVGNQGSGACAPGRDDSGSRRPVSRGPQGHIARRPGPHPRPSGLGAVRTHDPDATPGQVRSSSPNHSALQHHLATFPLRTGSWTGKQQRLRLAWRSSPITKLHLSPPRRPAFAPRDAFWDL